MSQRIWKWSTAGAAAGAALGLMLPRAYDYLFSSERFSNAAVDGTEAFMRKLILSEEYKHGRLQPALGSVFVTGVLVDRAAVVKDLEESKEYFKDELALALVQKRVLNNTMPFANEVTKKMFSQKTTDALVDVIKKSME